MQELRDRIAVVTGGGSGIGRGMASAIRAAFEKWRGWTDA